MLLLGGAAQSPAKTGPNPFLGGAVLRFHDAHLRQVYPHPVAIGLSVPLTTVNGVSLNATAAIAWERTESGRRGFVDQGQNRVRFLPVGLQAPYRLPLGAGWVAGAGPQLVWVWFREEWNASVRVADVEASGHATGTWVGVGGMIEIGTGAGRYGAFRLGAEANWTKGERRTARGNENRTEPMKGGWDMVYLRWSPPVR